MLSIVCMSSNWTTHLMSMFWNTLCFMSVGTRERGIFDRVSSPPYRLPVLLVLFRRPFLDDVLPVVDEDSLK